MAHVYAGCPSFTFKLDVLTQAMNRTETNEAQRAMIQIAVSSSGSFPGEFRSSP